MKRLVAFIAACALVWAPALEAGTKRGWRAPYEFRKMVPCPSTGKLTGACPGWVMDHMVSLRCGGPDTPENLWWQPVAEAKAKDKVEDECWRYYLPSTDYSKLKRT